MRKLFGVSLVVLAFAVAGMAQDVPRAEIFGGYSYFSADIRETQPLSNSTEDRISLHGWNAAVTGYANNWFGVTADVSGHYGSPEVGGANLDTSVHNFLFGPQVAFRSERASIFGRALFGGAKVKADVPGFGSVLDDTTFAWAVGGGVDIGVRNFALRLAQVDYIWTKARVTGLPDPDEAQNNFRYSAGIVLRF